MPRTDADLDTIAELNQAISILENATMVKEYGTDQRLAICSASYRDNLQKNEKDNGKKR